MANFTLQSLQEMLPSIRWADPVKVHWQQANSSEFYACRVCIANHGLRFGSNHQWKTFKECSAHIRAEHAIKGEVNG
jgi:hypothetical protein